MTTVETFPPQPLSDDEFAAARIAGTWTPLTVAAAEWAAQRLSMAENEYATIQAEVAEYVATVRKWAEDQLKTGRGAELARDREFFQRGLEAYARALRAQSVDRKGEARVKTIKLPSATLETKVAATPKPKFVVVDMDALVKWAEEAYPDAIVRTVDVKRLKLLAMETEVEGQPMGDELRGGGEVEQFVMTADGERVPGVDWDIDPPKEPSVTIRLHQDSQ